MSKYLYLLLITFLAFYNLNGFQNVDEKIRIDLIGQTIRSTNENAFWTFHNDDHINYVILNQRTTGPSDFRRLDYTIYLTACNSSENTDSLRRAEGVLKLVYKKSQSRNHFYLSQIEQLGFQIFPIKSSDKIILDNMEYFWLDFKRAVGFDDMEKVASMFNYPFESKYLGSYSNAKDLVKNHSKLFTDQLKQGIQQSILSPEKKSKGKEFNCETDKYIQICNYNYNINIDGFNNLFVVKLIDGNFKIVEILTVPID